MHPKRIHIVGAPGSGKSFLAARLSERFDIPVFELDEIFWRRRGDGSVLKTSDDELKRDLSEVLRRETWIVEGVYCKLIRPSFLSADVVIALVPPVWRRHWFIIKRFIKRKLRPLTHGNSGGFALLCRVIWYNHHYDRCQQPRVRALISKMNIHAQECRRADDAFTYLTSQ